MTEKLKVLQPFRNVAEYTAFLEGVKRTAELFDMKVDCMAWGGGIPTDLTLYKEKPEPVVTAEVEEVETKTRVRVKKKKDAEPTARAE